MTITGTRAIALIDCDSFFASCEQLMNPKLKDQPVCVMSNNDGCIVARSKEAKKLGIKMGMPVFQAKRDYPKVHYISGRLDLYGEISNRVMNILKQFSPTVEIYSIDEAFIDLTGLRRIHRKTYLEIAHEIKETIKRDVGIPVSVGISSSKVLAKLATSRAKDNNGFYIIGFRKITEELKNTQLIDIWGIGNNTTCLLNKYGVHTAYDLTVQKNEWIQRTLGKKGLEIKHELLGECVYQVTDKIELPKSIQKTSSFASFTADKDYVRNALHYHAHRACKKLRRLDIKTQLVGVMLRTKDFKILYGNNALLYPTNWEFEIFNSIDKTFQDIFTPDIIYRSSGVMLGNFTEINNSQLSLFENHEKRDIKDKLGQTWDNIEAKHGRNSISAGSYIENHTSKFNHISFINP